MSIAINFTVPFCFRNTVVVIKERIKKKIKANHGRAIHIASEASVSYFILLSEK